MRRLACIVLPAVLFLSGCSLFFQAPEPEAQFPEEVAAGWTKTVETPLLTEDLPPEATGGWGAVWEGSPSWIYANVVLCTSESAARALFDEIVSSLETHEQTSLGDEGIRLLHERTGLVIHIFRDGRRIAVVGSLAAEIEHAPSQATVEEAAEAIEDCVPLFATPQGACVVGRSGPAARPAGTESTDVSVPLFLGAADNGTLKLHLEATLTEQVYCTCTYTINVYLKEFSIKDEDGDAWPRGAGDLFIAGIVTLPCRTISFRTGELGDVDPNSGLSYGGAGRLISQLQCQFPCWQKTYAYSVNVLIRDNDGGDIPDLANGVIRAIAKAAPSKAGPAAEAAASLFEEDGLKESVTPSTPITEARNIKGDDVGEGSATGNGNLPPPDIEVVDNATCRSVSGTIPVDRTQQFSCTDPQVVSWVRLTGICRDPIVVRWEWFRDGESARTHQAQIGRSGAPNGLACAWDTLKPLDCETAPSEWVVKIYIDGVKKVEPSFTIEGVETEGPPPETE